MSERERECVCVSECVGCLMTPGLSKDIRCLA